MKLAPIIIVGGVIIAGLVAWKMGLLPDSANKAIDQGRAAVEEKISGDEAAVVDTPKSDCDTLTPDACYNLGETYRYGNGVEADKARAARILRQPVMVELRVAAKRWRTCTTQVMVSSRMGGSRSAIIQKPVRLETLPGAKLPAVESTVRGILMNPPGYLPSDVTWEQPYIATTSGRTTRNLEK